ncbi:hypothetical protein FQR65_LT19907 [Abscondita terminalis]|nr:hypothetical protein FQR65_LT19907 [Abscondita terminalis]
MMIGPLFNIMNSLFGLSNASVAAKRVNDQINATSIMNSHYYDGIMVDKLDGDIEFKNIEFNYPEKPDKLVLPKFNFSFKEGKSYAFVGETGSGKSTIAKLLLRFYDPTSGEIIINKSTNLKDVNLQSYLNHVGYVEQEPQILFGDIYENVKYGKFDATNEEVIEAYGYETILGERGFLLSGGQKQRLVIARIFLKNPKILILDEATSALDNIVEKEIQEKLDVLMKGRTAISIAHRLSTIKNCDEIIVLGANGKGVVQRGTFEQLKNTEGEAKGFAMQAIKAAKEGDFDKAQKMLDDSEKSRVQASHAHMDVIAKEAQGEKLQIPVLFMHAEDQMMNTETLTLLAKEMWGCKMYYLVGILKDVGDNKIIIETKNGIGPKKFEDYIGQKNIVDNLKIIIDSCEKRKETLDHIMLHGSSGIGKTSLAYLISEVLKTKIIILNGTNLVKPSDIISPLTSIKENQILFIDEIHASSKEVLEVLYPVLEDNKISVIFGKDYNSKVINIKLPKFTIICATTEINKLASPFINRFPINFYLENYTQDEISEIIFKNSKKLNFNIDRRISFLLADYTKFNPRISLNLLKRIYDYYVVGEISEVDENNLYLILNKLNIYKYGLTIQDLKYLQIVKENVCIGLDSINQIMDTNVSTIVNIIEPNLIKHNLIRKSSKGRSITEKAISYLKNINT